MTTAKHTPGPWRITRERDGKSGWNGLSVESPSGFVANLVFQLDDSGLANARLIAAAPKLLEACNYALRFALLSAEPVAKGDPYMSIAADRVYPAIEKLQAAIAEAEGGAR